MILQSQKEKLKRKNQFCFLLNDHELNVINKFCKKYKISNRSKFIRETVISSILNKLDEDYPTLFSENDMK